MMKIISLEGFAAFAVAWTMLAGCGGSKPVTPLVEAMPPASFETPSPRDCVRKVGETRVWDFTRGSLPAGGKLNGGSVLGPGGIGATSPTNMSVASGFVLDRLWTPSGAFLFEADVVFGELCAPDLPPHEGILWDDLAITYSPKHTHRGFQLQMDVRNGICTPVLYAGFSNGTSVVRGPSVPVAPGKAATVSFCFSAGGRVVWEFAGERLDSALDRSGPLAPSVRFRPVIGDRAVSNHHPFDGTIRRVSISSCERDTVDVAVEGRTAFVRGETNAAVTIRVGNVTSTAISNVCAVAEQFVEGGRVRRGEFRLGTLAAESSASFPCAVETRIRPGWRALRVSLTGKDAGGNAVESVRTFRIGVGPRDGDGMTALMWGYGAAMEPALADFGFTHGLAYARPGDPNARKAYDEALVHGVRLLHSMRTEYPGGKADERYARKGRDGKPVTYGKRGDLVPEVSNPAFLETMKPLIRDDARLYGGHPGFVGVLAISEARDATAPSFNTEHERYRKETGRDVPPEVTGKKLDRKGLADAKLKFPDGIVPADDPILSYYRWFWKGGDGWPGYSGGIADEYHRQVDRPGFFVFWDPAVRCPPIWGSGGAVDMLNQWVYAVPEPMNVAGPAEEILAMAAGRIGQRPAIMTQLICYRSQIAPMGRKVEPEPEWVRRRPLADFPTIPPDILQEATWSMLAKPVQAVMYHGWGTICETGKGTGYVYTNPESADRLRHMLKGVVAPLGPMLKRLGREAPPVAVLESFTTCAFGGPASWGWKAPSITFMQRARLDPRVVYEETIIRDGLDGVKVLYAPQCMFLTKPVVDRIREFQSRGGILVADEQLLAALAADVKAPVVSFEPPPASDHTEDVDAMEASREGDAKTRLGTMRAKANMLKQAENLRRELASRYVPEADSSSPEIVVYSRRWNGVRYLFAVNDHRTFGQYVGQWGLTMERGLPYEGSVSLADDGSTVAVYELSRGGEARFSRKGGRIEVPVRYDTNDGRLFAFLKERIGSVDVDAPSRVCAGESVRVTFRVLDGKGKPIQALLPGEIRMFDAVGRELDGAGFVCVQSGTCTVDILTNVDDADGDYRLVCRDRASGLTAERTIRRRR